MIGREQAFELAHQVALAQGVIMSGAALLSEGIADPEKLAVSVMVVVEAALRPLLPELARAETALRALT